MLAGRLDADLPLEFKEEPALHEAEGEIYASRSDLARALSRGASMKLIATWEHAGLMVSAAPLTWVVMAPHGLHGVHRVTVAAASAAAAKPILAKLMQGCGQAVHLRGVLRGGGTRRRRCATWRAANPPRRA